MTWVAKDDFESYSVATLNGTNGGTGFNTTWGALGSFLPGNINVVSSPTYQGTRAVQGGVLGESAERGLTTTLTGDGNVAYVAMYRTGNAGTDPALWRWASSGDVTRLKISLNTSGNLSIDGSTSVTLLAGYSINTWYVIRVTINVTANTATAAYSTGAFGSSGTFGTESSAVTMTSTGALDRIEINSGSVTAYYDSLSDVTPFVSAALSVSTLEMMGV